MKALKYTVLVATLVSGLALTAKADLILSPFGDIPKNGTGIGGGNSDNQVNQFFRLQNYIVAHPAFGTLGTPTDIGAEEVLNIHDPVNLTGFCYAVVHYGAGPGGTPGGGVAFFQITNGLDTFPQTGSGPNGFGGISRIDLFACTPTGVPDGGPTVMLLGAALTGLGLVRRYLKH